jgi:thiol-disulfide isomerase/thioredoxin
VLYRISVLALGLAGCATVEARTALPRLPQAQVAGLDGAATTLAAELRGRPALVTLWATWCEACMREMDPLQRLAAKAWASGGVVVAVAVGEPRDKVASFVAGKNISYPQLVDEGFHFADALGARRVPATLVVDGRGEVVFFGGELDGAALDAFRRVLSPATARTP